MASKVSVCSNALLLVGANPIASFDGEGVDQASVTLVSNLWDYIRDNTIRSHLWACCIKRVQLSPSTNRPPVFEDFQYAFNLPGDCLRVLSISEYERPLSHKVEGQQVLSNFTPLYLRYLFRNEEVATWDAGLVEIMTLNMASAIAYPLKQSGELSDRFKKEAEFKLRRARAADANQSTQAGIIDSPLTAVRGVGSNGYPY